ncbi:MAG: helix-turn-helix domain-containing protein [Desulfobacterales bacterium]
MKGNTFQELREREQHLRREIILDATEMLFSQRAFHQINMKDIADEANVSVASIYRYFESQDDLLLAVLLKHIDNVDNLIEGLVSAASSSMEDISRIFVDYLLDNEAAFQIVCHFMIKGDRSSNVFREFESVKSGFLDKFDSGLVTMGYQKHTRLFSDSFFASILGIVLIHRDLGNPGASGKRNDLHELAKFAANAFHVAMSERSR